MRNKEMMSTLALAKKLGQVETINATSRIGISHSKQPFDFLFVLDFESTCWEDKDINRSSPEIIEFSVVLYDISQCEIIEEFQQYVTPTENTKLSEFCRQFTGISQKEVEEGRPLRNCLPFFTKWIHKVSLEYNITFSSICEWEKKAVFVTWSDWDLKTCLPNECRRKLIQIPDFLNSWIDIRLLYREYYQRRPRGLRGALMEQGLHFQGREHCGLIDARNTALLCRKMITDGIILRITSNKLN